MTTRESVAPTGWYIRPLPPRPQARWTCEEIKLEPGTLVKKERWHCREDSRGEYWRWDACEYECKEKNEPKVSLLESFRPGERGILRKGDYFGLYFVL